jgi:hypothetical protein
MLVIREGRGQFPILQEVYTRIITSNYTASKGDKVLADTSAGSFTVTLPASPSPNDRLEIYDVSGTWASKNLVLSRNGSNINGVASDVTLNVSNKKFEVVYTNASYGWRMF